MRSRPHGHVAAVMGTMRRGGEILSTRKHRNRQRALAMIAARILDSSSKLATARTKSQRQVLLGLLASSGRHGGRSGHARQYPHRAGVAAAWDRLNHGSWGAQDPQVDEEGRPAPALQQPSSVRFASPGMPGAGWRSPPPGLSFRESTRSRQGRSEGRPENRFHSNEGAGCHPCPGASPGTSTGPRPVSPRPQKPGVLRR